MAGPFTYPVAVSVPFDGTERSDGTPVYPVFESTNVRDAIIEARNFPSFSVQFIPEGSYLFIPENEQMSVHGVWYNDGYVELEGQLVLEE